ncbi:MAG: DUF1570 domain-containing protein [Planctomycetota bacterium]
MTAPSTHRHTPAALLSCTLALLLTAWLAQTTTAQPVDLRTVKSRAYTIHTNLSNAELKPYAQHMDQVYAAFSRRFADFRARTKRQPDLYLFATQRDYVQHMATLGINASASGGMFFYRGSESGLATFTDDVPMDFTLETLQHEGFHQFAFSHIGTDLPLWVNEGLAVYFEQAIMVRGKLKLGVAEPRRIQIMRDAINNNQAMRFNDLINITSQQWHSNMLSGHPHGRLQYTQSWSVVHFLIHGDNGKYRRAFQRYLSLISNGRTSQTAFAEAFGTNDTDGFARRWRQYTLEELEPDPLTTAVGRLHFLGAGLLLLRERGEPTPASLDELKAALKRIGFTRTPRNEAGTTEFKADDESLYVYLNRRGQPTPFQLKPARKPQDLPTLHATQLRPTANLTWTTDEDDNPVADVTFR